ncbi:hypothetical protein V1477_013988 [Vespula maculifrons]|uniref:Uncharacterized protein n=1 Tax=Vespula maculifrons TaxID=7453 RepID=A0ABD2BLA0_VESMC
MGQRYVWQKGSESPVYSSNARTRQEHPIYNTLSSGDGNGGGGNGVDIGVGVGAGVGAGAGWSYVSKGEVVHKGRTRKRKVKKKLKEG